MRKVTTQEKRAREKFCYYRVWGGYCVHRLNKNYKTELKKRTYKRCLPAKVCKYNVKECIYLKMSDR